MIPGILSKFLHISDQNGCALHPVYGQANEAINLHLLIWKDAIQIVYNLLSQVPFL